MKPILHIGLLILVGLTAACSKHDTPPLEEDMLYKVERSYQSNPDSALRILDTVDVSVLSAKERAHYCLVRAEICFQVCKNLAEADSLLQIAEKHFIGGTDKYYEAKTYWIASWRAAATDKGDRIVLDYRLKALQSIEQCHHVDERLVRFSAMPTDEQGEIDQLKYAIHQRLGISYANNGYYKEGILHLKASESYFAERQNYLPHIISAYSLGLAYLNLNEFDSCLMYYEKGLHSAEDMNNIEQCAYYHRLVADYYRYRTETQQYADETERQHLIQQSVAECRQGLEILKSANGMVATGGKCQLYEQLSQSYFDLQQFDSCIRYSHLALDIVKGNKNSDSYELNKRLYKSYKAIGDEENAACFAELLVNHENDEAKEQKAVAEVKAEYDKQLELQRLASEQQLKRYRLYLWIALLAIGLMAMLWMVFRYRKNKELEILRLREAQRQLQTELEKLTVQQWEMLQQQAMAIYQTGQKDRLQRIMEAFESAYPQAHEKLKSAYSNLNDSECRVVILSFLGFRGKEVADLLGLTENTAMKYRSNIRKKVGNDPISGLS